VPVINAASQVVTSQPLQIQWKDGVRIHVGCGEVQIVPGEGYICTSCGALSFSDVPSEEELERQEAEDEEWREREREEYNRQEREAMERRQ